jgi:hypothetical protein
MSSYNKIYRSGVNQSYNSSKEGQEALKDQRRVRMCLSKVGYDTEFEAQVMAAHSSARPHAKKLRVYKCSYCNHYHLTSKERYGEK